MSRNTVHVNWDEGANGDYMREALAIAATLEAEGKGDVHVYDLGNGAEVKWDVKFIDTKTGREAEGAYLTLCERAWEMAEKGQLRTFNGSPCFAFRDDDASTALAVSRDVEGDSVDMYADPESRHVWGYAFEGYREEWLPLVKVEEVTT